MARIVRGGLIQATLCEPATSSVAKIKQAMNDKHEALLAQAVAKGAQIVCFQELFHGPYFCAEQQIRWYDITERIPDVAPAFFFLVHRTIRQKQKTIN